MTHDALIFDIDGTLWNACPASAKGWNVGLVRLGIDQRVTSGQIASVAGNPYETCIDLLLPGQRARHPVLTEMLEECENQVVRSDGGAFYPGAVDGVTRLAGNYRIFLVSNCQAWYLDLFLCFSGLGPALSGVDCYGLSGVPKSGMLAKMKREHSLSNPVYIGDTAGDERAAASAGVDFIHAAWGFGTPTGKPKAVSSFAELLDRLEAEASSHPEKLDG